ncbi:NAD(P)H-dependent flavin oxidoreductase [Acrocarpospora catenulata]|uniref:NAD(P)H-dependent flavin oxidoreductase n=1 Tax=Acrocarpospora catenulata TaxID=2836182 RepID=UPI001BD94D62|nr:nitronate monooxygenase [Acrocarpospora catenulata]
MSAPVTIASRFADLLGITHPVVQEGLGPYRTVRLAAAVSNAGGLGTVSIPGVSEEPARGAAILRGYIEETCALTDRPFAVNVPVGTAADGEVLPFSAAYVGAVVEAVRDPEIARRLRMITTSAGPPGVVRPLIAESGLLHAHKVGGTRQAIRARREGADVIVASGYEAGGHTHARPVHTFVLGPSVAAAVDCPVVLAGGVRDGATMAAALALGADAVALGTRFVASRDNTDWHPAYARRVLAAREGEDITFPAIYGPSRALPSRGVDELAEIVAGGGLDLAALTAWKDERLIRAQRDGDVDGGILPAGQVSGAIDDLVDVAEFLPAMVADAAAVLAALNARTRPAPPA